MAKKGQPSQEALDAINSAPRAKNPAPTAADIQAFRGMKRRGYTNEEILPIARKVYPSFDEKLLSTNSGRTAGSLNKPKATT